MGELNSIAVIQMTDFQAIMFLIKVPITVIPTGRPAPPAQMVVLLLNLPGQAKLPLIHQLF